MQVEQYQEESEEEDAEGESRTNTIRVTGIEKPVTEDHLRLYFESPKRGAGEVIRMDYNKEEGTALLIFASPESKQFSYLQRQP